MNKQMEKGLGEVGNVLANVQYMIRSMYGGWIGAIEGWKIFEVHVGYGAVSVL